MKLKKKKRRVTKKSPLAKLLGILGIVVGVLLIISTNYFNIESFDVVGNSYYSDEEVLVMGNCKTGGNIFWDADLKDIKARLEKDAYMSDVKVKRVFPNQIRIELDERTQIAAVVYYTSLQFSKIHITFLPSFIMVPTIGLEPTTYTLPWCCSTY